MTRKSNQWGAKPLKGTVPYNGCFSSFVKLYCKGVERESSSLNTKELRELQNIYRRLTRPSKCEGKTRTPNSKYLRADTSERALIKAGKAGRPSYQHKVKETAKAARLFGKD